MLSDVLPILVRMSKQFQERFLDFAQLKLSVNVAICSREQLLHSPGEHLASHAELAAVLEEKGITLVHTVGNSTTEFGTFQ